MSNNFKNRIHMTEEEKQTANSDSSLDVLNKINSKELPKEMEIFIKGLSTITLKGDKGDSIKGEKGDKGERGLSGTSIVGSRGLKGDKGKKGDTPTKDEVLNLIKPLIPKPIKGDKGNTPIKNVDYFDGEKGEDGSPDTSDEVVEKINKAKKKISWKQIKDVPNFDERDTMNQSGYVGGVGDLSLKFFSQDLSDQLNGITKSFTISQNRMILSIQSSSFPWIFRPIIDYTISGVSRETLTFTDEITATATLAEGQTLIITGIKP